MNIDKETSEKIEELQILEQNLQNFFMQKQSIQIELNEVLNALSEVKKTADDIYKVIGGVMIKSNKDQLIKELEEKKKILDLRIGSIEKQEKIIESKAAGLKSEITDVVNKKKS